eukprot:3465242-Amphidinium_carterae.4
MTQSVRGLPRQLEGGGLSGVCAHNSQAAVEQVITSVFMLHLYGATTAKLTPMCEAGEGTHMLGVSAFLLLGRDSSGGVNGQRGVAVDAGFLRVVPCRCGFDKIIANHGYNNANGGSLMNCIMADGPTGRDKHVDEDSCGEWHRLHDS